MTRQLPVPRPRHIAPALVAEIHVQHGSTLLTAGSFREVERLFEMLAPDLARSDQSRSRALGRVLRATARARRGVAQDEPDVLIDELPDRRARQFIHLLESERLFSARAHGACVAQIERAVPVGDVIMYITPVRLLFLLATCHMRAGDSARAREVVDAMQGRGRYGRACSALVRAQLSLLHGQADEAEQEARAAAEGLDALGVQHEAAGAWLTLADALGVLGRAGADDAARRAHKGFTACGAEVDLRESRVLLRRLGVGVAPRRGRGTDGPLSGRELEVAHLVAQGMTNKQVAAALFVSPSTVSTHLKRIYRRLEIGGRAALATWLAEQGS